MGYTRSFDRWPGTSGPHGPMSALLAVLAMGRTTLTMLFLTLSKAVFLAMQALLLHAGFDYLLRVRVT